jgi:sarcosine oxidase, subunit beta
MPERGYEVAVLGAGCAGAAVAYALARRRIVPVVVDTAIADSPVPASPVVSVMSGNTADARLAIRAAERLPDLQDAIGAFGYRRTGGMWAALSEADAGVGQARAQAGREAGLPMVWLTREETLRREPFVSENVAGTVYCHLDGIAHAPALKRRLLSAAGRFGATMHLECGYVAVARQAGGVRITAGREAVTARRLVVATAEVLRAVERSLGTDIPTRVSPRRLCITDPAAPGLRHTVGGIRQEPSGEYVLNPTVVVDDSGSATDMAGDVGVIRNIVASALRIVPAVEGTRVVHAPQWRVTEIADGRPAVGRVDDNLFLAIAPDDQAVTLALLIAETIADGMVKHRWPDGFDIWAPERFGRPRAAAAAGVQDSPEGS